jgi:hypothetical protein
MSNIFGGAYIREGFASSVLSADNLDDRIINLKFIRKSGRWFTIRSDYEPVFHGDDTVSFKPCVEKPDIKVSYKQVAESVAVEVNIEVNNLTMGDGEKADLHMDAADGDPVQWCVIQMGYRAQFPDWSQTKDTAGIQRFYDLNNSALTQAAAVSGGSQILVQILTGYPISYPPDKVMYFKGIIGTMENGLRWQHGVDELVKGYGDPAFPDNFSALEEVLFQFVTRRFVRPSVPHIAHTVQDFTSQEAMDAVTEKQFEQRIVIYDYDGYPQPGADALDRLRVSALKAEDALDDKKTWKMLPVTENGIMTIEDANRFGVICIVSKTLRSMAADSLPGHVLDAEQADALGPVPPSPFNTMVDALGGQLVMIQKQYPFLRWYELMDGSFFFYHKDDTDKDLWTDPFIKKMQKDNTRLLPAVYDITAAGMRTIRCPFMSFISPMMTVLFQSRFSIGTLTSYFYPVKTNAFLVITSSVEFATVQDINTAELACVDLPPHEVEINEETGEVVVKEDARDDKTPEVARMQEARNERWVEQQLKVVKHRTNAAETFSSWGNIVTNEVLNDARPESWPEGTALDEKLALETLKGWNPGYFDAGQKYMKRGNSIENLGTGIGGRTGIKVPWLEAGDVITIRRPFQAEYPEEYGGMI